MPGDALFFHSNLLHTSDKNLSDKRRWAFLCAYNRADNNPVYKHHHAQYTPLDMVSKGANWLNIIFWNIDFHCFYSLYFYH